MWKDFQLKNRKKETINEGIGPEATDTIITGILLSSARTK